MQAPGREALPRRFLVTWRDGERPRGIHPVGCLTVDDRFTFRYLPGAAVAPGFRALPGFPDMDRSYTAPALFLFFAARLMDRRRPDYDDYVEALDLPPHTEDLDVLSRSEGVLKGDRVAVVEEPLVRSDGSTEHVFVVRGVRFAAPASAERERRLAGLAPGTPLTVRADVDNPVNSAALQLLNPGGHLVGWVPDALVSYVSSALVEGGARAVVQRLNGPDLPPHIRLLARLSGRLPIGRPPLPQLHDPVDLATR